MVKESTPNLDEVVIAANDLGQETLQRVSELLSKLADAIGPDEGESESEE